VTSCAVMLLVEDGRIALDHLVGLPPGSVTARVPSWRHRIDDTGTGGVVTIRQLMTHTSGRRASFDPGSPLILAPRRARRFRPICVPGRDDEEAGSAATFFQPGTQWKYSPGTDVPGGSSR
jgi:CubicO group peptidase (beta-lactamase class C family)